MRVLLISFSNLPVYANSLVIQKKYLSESVETYGLGSNKFDNLYLKNKEDFTFLTVNTSLTPRPSFESFKIWKKEKSKIINFIKVNKITHIYFINKHIWNLFLIASIQNLNIKFYHCLHDPIGHNGDKISKGVLYYNKVLIHYLDGIVVLSDNSYNDTKNYLKPKCNIVKLPLIQTEWLPFTNLRNFNTVLFFGRLNNYKGLDYVPLLADEMFKLDPTIQIIVAGKKSDDLDESVLTNLSNRPNIKLYEGFVDESKLDDYYFESSMVLIPYKSITQSGIIVDSYNHSRTIACFNIKGIEEFITNENAIIIDNFDYKLMAKKIVETLHNKEELEKLSKASYELGKKLYSPEVWKEKFIEFLKNN